METKTITKVKAEKLRESKKRKGAAIDFLKTVAIYLLTISMLRTAGLYINEKQNAGQTAEIPWEKRIIFESGGTVSAVAEINENHINPVQITVTVENHSYTAVYNEKLISNIYEYEKNFKTIVRGLFNKNSECRRLEKEEGDEFWRKCVEKENSVYIKYAGNYLYPVIYAFLNESYTRNT